MAAGPVLITVLDGQGVGRLMKVWSADGTGSGALSFMQTLLGGDVINPASGANPIPVAGVGLNNFTPVQVTMNTGPTLIIAARAGRANVTVENTGNVGVFIGPTSAVTVTNGMLLPGVIGASITLPYTGALYGVTAAGSQVLTLYELY